MQGTQESAAPITIVEYDPTWPAQFETERQHLTTLLNPWLAGTIEHVGSTAVPGLVAKPVIDIMAPVESLLTSRPAIAALEALQYCYSEYKLEEMHWFCKPSPQHRTHHLHLIPINSSLWLERLAFRDALRSNEQLAGEYAALKQELAQQHSQDREAYTEAKAPFIKKVLLAE